MLVKGKFFNVFKSCIIAILILAFFPVHGFAAVQSWDQYTSYIPQNPPIVKRHLRGAWVSTTINLDWPSKASSQIANDRERIQKTKDELISILDKSVEMNINAVFLQVSPEGDAFYKSDIVPWSRYLTGTFGKDPGFDPLAFAVEEAHKRNLELHAWFNPYRISMYTNDATIQSLNIDKSVYKDHPEWVRTAKARFVVDPGIPQAREWVKDRVMEVVNKYDIDGVHFDDYFYYEDYAGELEDQATFAKYNTGGFSNIGDWRRNNTYLLVKELSHKINSAKSWVKFGISPAGIWANKKDGYPNGSDTNAGLPNYNRSFADTKKWVEEEIIDYIAPQIYFTFSNPNAPYGEVASWWSRVVKNKNVHLYIGQALYKVNEDADQYFMGNNAIEEFNRQLKFNLTKPEIQGSIMFRFRNLNDPNKQELVNNLRNNLWSTKALVPTMPWKKGQAPGQPIQGKIETLSGGNKLSWVDGGTNTTYYGIYRINKGENLDINSDQSITKLIASVRKTGQPVQEFLDGQVSSSKDVEYVVTAFDRLHNESEGLIIGSDQSANFNDIGRQYFWAVKAIDNLYERGIVSGVGGGKFMPANNVTRADFLIMVMKSYNLEVNPNIEDNFSDAGDKYYTKYLGTAKNLGLVSGIGNNLYAPESPISRQDMFVILYSVLEKLGQEPNNINADKPFDQYNDVGEIAQYAVKPMKAFVEAGIIRGDGLGLRPRANTSRAETAQVLYNLYSK